MLVSWIRENLNNRNPEWEKTQFGQWMFHLTDCTHFDILEINCLIFNQYTVTANNTRGPGRHQKQGEPKGKMGDQVGQYRLSCSPWHGVTPTFFGYQSCLYKCFNACAYVCDSVVTPGRGWNTTARHWVGHPDTQPATSPHFPSMPHWSSPGLLLLVLPSWPVPVDQCTPPQPCASYPRFSFSSPQVSRSCVGRCHHPTDNKGE